MARIPDAIKHKFQRMVEEAKGDKRFQSFLCCDSKDENFKWAYEFAYERAYGKPLQNVDMDVNDATDRPTKEELDAALRSVNGHSEGNGVEKAE